MIPAIDPGIGLKEDRPEPRAIHSENPAFGRALRRAESRTETASRRSINDAGEARARRLVKEESAREDARTDRASGAEQPDAPRREHDTATDRVPAEQAAADGAAPHTSRLATSPDDTEETGDTAGLAASTEPGVQPLASTAEPVPGLGNAAQAAAPVEGLALRAVGAQLPLRNYTDTRPIGEQLGAAAYRIGVHGKDEALFAAANGQVLPGSITSEMVGQGVRDVNVATLKQAEERGNVPAGRVAHGDETAILQLGAATKELASETRGAAQKEQIALQTAQARNEVLSRLTIAGGDGATAGGEQEEADSLRQFLQTQGLLARDARSHTLDTATPKAAAGATAPAITPNLNSAALTSIYEAADDPAVEQRVIQRVASEARWLINNDRQEVTLRLQPEHLGNLHMKVLHKDGQFSVHITVDNASAKHLLESNLQDLRDRLGAEHQGSEFMFNVDVRQGNDQPSLYARSARTAPLGVGRVGALEELPAPGLAGRVIGHSGLSIYV